MFVLSQKTYQTDITNSPRRSSKEDATPGLKLPSLSISGVVSERDSLQVPKSARSVKSIDETTPRRVPTAPRSARNMRASNPKAAASTADLDCWPASTTHRDMLISKLEEHLDQELEKADEVPDRSASLEIKHEAYKTCLGAYAQRLRLYGPLMSRILDGYEDYIEFLKTRASFTSPALRERALHNLRETLGEPEMDPIKLRALLNESEKKLAESAMSLERKDAEIRNLMAQLHDSVAEIDRLKSKVAEKEELVKDKEDMIADLRQTMFEIRTENTLIMNQFEALKIQFLALQAEHTNMSMPDFKDEPTSGSQDQQLSIAIDALGADGSSSVPQDEYEDMKMQTEIAKHKLFAQRDQIASLRFEKTRMVVEIARLRRSEEMLEREVASLRRGESGMTPRPDWTRAESRVPGLKTSGRKSLRIAEDLYAEIDKLRAELEKSNHELEHAQRKLTSADEQSAEVVKAAEKGFTGLGFGPDVPRYLRFHGKVPNRLILKREIEHLIRDVWRMKGAWEQEHSSPIPLDEFFYLYLEHKHGTQAAIAEAGYNIIDSLQRYKADADCEMFLKILQGHLSEDAHKDQLQMMENLKQMFSKLSQDQRTPLIPRKDVLAAIAKFFPAKGEAELTACRTALSEQQPSSDFVDVSKLFEEDEDGNQGPFAECIRDQHLQEIEEYAVDIEQVLISRDKESKHRITLTKVKEALREADPQKPTKEIHSFVLRGIKADPNTPAQSVNWNQDVNIADFMKNLKQGLVRRTGRKIPFLV